MKKAYLYSGMALLLIAAGAFGIHGFKKDLEFQKSVLVARTLAENSLAARYTSLMFETVDLEPGDCFVCSADGFPPSGSIEAGKVKPFTHYNMLAYILSGSPIESDTLPLTVTIHGMDTSEEITVEAKITPLTKALYTAEFEFPQDKVPEKVPSYMSLQCGAGTEYSYYFYNDTLRISPQLFLREQPHNSVTENLPSPSEH